MDINRLSSGVLTGKILILLGIIFTAVYPLMFLYWHLVTLSVPLGGYGIQQIDPEGSPLVILCILSTIGFAIGITAFLTEDSRKTGKLAMLAGVLAGNFLNWICLIVVIIGGILCYACAGPGEK